MKFFAPVSVTMPLSLKKTFQMVIKFVLCIWKTTVESRCAMLESDAQRMVSWVRSQYRMQLEKLTVRALAHFHAHRSFANFFSVFPTSTGICERQALFFEFIMKRCTLFPTFFRLARCSYDCFFGYTEKGPRHDCQVRNDLISNPSEPCVCMHACMYVCVCLEKICELYSHRNPLCGGKHGYDVV